MRRRLRAAPLKGRVVLIVQRVWVIASALSNAFQANGAHVLLAANPRSGLALADHPRLSAAVLNGRSRELCRQLEVRGIPFLLYTGRDQIDDECAEAPIVRKPASPADVVDRVERLLI